MKKTTFAILIAILAVFMTALTADAEAKVRASRPGINPSDAQLKANVLAIMQNTLAQYDKTDFAWVWDQMVVHGNRDSAGNFMVIPLVRGAANVAKYELQDRNPMFIDAALTDFELAQNLYPYWGHGWLSPSVVNFQVLAVYRLHQLAGNDPIYGARIEVLWTATLEELKEEADGVLGQVLPLAPLDSSVTGDTKAEEDAWIASVLSAAVVFLPNDPHAADWAAKAKETAYAAITRPSDAPYQPDMVKTITVAEDFSLDNHGFPQNAYYSAATIELLLQATVPYLVTGQTVPEEFSHNAKGLYAKYQTYITPDANGWPKWNVACDEGDPTDLPLVMGDASEYRYASMKAQSGILWQAAVLQSTISNDELWKAVQNHKVAWRYFVNVFLQHWPAPVSR